MTISGKTRILGIIGDPVEHSRSPQMQNSALAAVGLDYIYVPFHVRSELLGEAVAGLRAAGVTGFNVTIPHKVAIIPFLDRLSPEAAEIGAVNTVCNENGTLIGYNTDGIGLVSSLRSELGFELSGRKLIVIGAGGAARAAIHACSAAGASQLIIVNRTLDKAAGIASRYKVLFPKVHFICCRSLSVPDYTADLLINTTSIGMDGVSPAADIEMIGSDCAVYDMIYVPSETPLLSSARRRGLRCANGLGMLAAQGERSFTIWTGVTPPAEVMKNVLLKQ